MPKFLLILLLGLSVHNFGQSRYQSPPPPPPAAQPVEIPEVIVGNTHEDSVGSKKIETDNVVYPRNFEENFQRKYRGAEFDYTTVKPRESLWEKLQKRFRRLFENIFGTVDPNLSTDYLNNIMRVFAIIIIGFVLYFLIRVLLGKDGNFFFSKKKGKLNIKASEIHENIHEINFAEEISSFERQKDYRSAVRFRYLLLLKNLSDKKIIEWNPEKTNKDYYFEIKDATVKNHFSDLSYIFDYVWYGEFDINESDYIIFRERFQKVKI